MRDSVKHTRVACVLFLNFHARPLGSEHLGANSRKKIAAFNTALTLENGVDIWSFVRLSAKITAWHCNYLVFVYIRFWALNLA